ncbi:GNAT family N-acetyltransferase [Actinacidiphila yeochonensis]|uniref:GNAT family N-acetyltransferase n=1 Tax=Actinacidiphila yeochonensis TaxID=89050 RepID=UPI000564CF1D|nr:GNAT family N-acetyltransferase [Actinacidiphila yeochonensis]
MAPAVREAAARGGHVLDSPVWTALGGAHRHLGVELGLARRYRDEVAPFAALSDAADPRAWTDLAELVGPGGTVTLVGVEQLPEGWSGEPIQGVQLVATTVRGERDAEAVALGAADVPEMLDLVARTRPGPFRPRTVETGSYVGIRRGGELVAMAGERLSLPGWTEISAVCTDAGHRGQGLAGRLVRHVAAGIGARGDTPFLHSAAENPGAIRLYEALGFTRRRATVFHLVTAPGAAG